MAGDVVIHRAYFGAGDMEDLQQRVAYLWRKQQEGVVDAEVVDDSRKVDPENRDREWTSTVTRAWHEARMEAYHALLMREMGLWLEPMTVVGPDAVMQQLRKLTPAACAPPF